MNNDRDSSIERLLPNALRAPARPGPAGPCLDADAVAAWSDGTLTAGERAAAEAHAADCGRCQALLAAMVRTAPPPAAARWWRAPLVSWLVPLAVTATAVCVWIALPRRSILEPAARPDAPVSTEAKRGEEAARAAARQREKQAAPPPSAVAPPADAAAARTGSVRLQPDQSDHLQAALLDPAAPAAALAAAPAAARPGQPGLRRDAKERAEGELAFMRRDVGRADAAL